MAYKSFEIPSTLHKTAGTSGYRVGGVASSFHRDLDGDAITPDAVRRAIPGFMACRGGDRHQGGAIRLHHDFWTGFLKRAVSSLNLPQEKQLEMVSAIALPLGRVTEMWVDSEGQTHWRGYLSEANPIAKIIWGMLKENLISLGVSLGGKIFRTKPGADGIGQRCNLITDIRIDELSITDNPALRLTQEEGTGAYITALAKSIRNTMTDKGAIAPKDSDSKKRSLKKKDSKTTVEPNGNMTGLLADLHKACSDADPKLFKSAEFLQKCGDGLASMVNLTPTPPDELINFLKYFHHWHQFLGSLPYMDQYQSDGTIAAMASDMHKAIEQVQESISPQLMGQRFRPPVSTMEIQFPDQYITNLR